MARAVTRPTFNRVHRLAKTPPNLGPTVTWPAQGVPKREPGGG